MTLFEIRYGLKLNKSKMAAILGMAAKFRLFFYEDNK